MRHRNSCVAIALVSIVTSLPRLAWCQSKEAVTPPVVQTHVDAVYPLSALAERKHADVVLSVTVDKEGHVSNIEVIASGGADLDEAAIVAVRQWTFEPAKRGGVPVASRIRVPFHFAAPAPAPEVIPAPAKPGVQGSSATPVPGANAAVTGPSSDVLSKPPQEPVEVTVTGRPNPPSRGVSDFRIPRRTLTAAPHASAADLLSTVPGVVIAHPEGEAVAQRIYLRGFDAEHGQDVEFKVAGIPLNQQSHIHGQGYADLNIIIPETVRSLRVIEGVYDPHQADFAVAGSIEYDLGIEERRSRLKLSTGSFGTRRLLALWAPEGQPEETFGAATFRETDGFGNGTRGTISGGALGQYRLALPNNATLLVHVAGYGARANTAGVLRRDDLSRGKVGLYDSYPDPSARSQSAGTSRTQLGVTFEQHTDDGSRTSAGVWTYLASFRSRMNFTGYTERSEFDPTWVGRGDLIEQSNDDFGLGGTLSHRSKLHKPWSWFHAQYELGSDIRTHRIEQAQNLLRAPQNEIWDQRDDASIRQTDVGFYADVLLRASRYLRIRGGARADVLFFDVDDRLGNFIPATSKKTHILGFHRTANGIAIGPRATLEVDPTSFLRLSASYGEGYRSPQARQLEEGEQAPFAKVRSYEAGAILKDGERASLSAVAYQTSLSYDLAFDPSAGRLERLGPTTRRGLVGYFIANPAPWMSAAVSATYVHATLDSPPIPTPENPTPPYISGQALPYVPPVVVRCDLGVQKEIGAFWGKSLHWKAGYGTTFLSSRPLPYSEFSPPVFLLDGTAGVRREWLELSIEASNLLNAHYADTEYSFVSNWLTTAVPSRVPARHITAGAPRTFLASLTVFL